ncbi:helix-turn-helix domain-containing protein [Chitinimonas taiwanensis]|uniref:helix-turn-helix domain-containing protein n=1 Tax=Chitinimonas taiwanensis TaxID=240412 RepID=UPI000931AAA7|nr:helix-turn-helix transcriptional regulator [Chitinimonas taiwanensis]
MKSTLEYLDEWKEAQGITSDYAAAAKLGVTRSAISNWRKGRAGMDDYTAAQVAAGLGIEAIEVISAANAEREHDELKKEFWINLYRTVAQSMAAVTTGKTVLAAAMKKAPVLKTEAPSSWRKGGDSNPR